MVQVHPFLLWLGHIGDCRDFGCLAECGIEAVVQLAAEEQPVMLPRDILSCRVPLVDGTGNPDHRLRFAVEIVVRLIKDRTPTLVCCSAGASRSPAVAARALSVVELAEANECLQRVQRCRKVDVSPGLWQDLLAVQW